MKKNATLQSILTHLAEEAALPGEIDLWPAIQARLAASNTLSQRREPEMNTKITRNIRRRAAQLCAIALLLAAGVLFGLPQGRAWAQSILRFFIRSEDQMTLPTPEPVNLVGVTPGATLPVRTPTGAWHPAFYATCSDLPAPRCSFEQIRGMVEFPVKGIADLPEGLDFIGATGGPEGVTLAYRWNEPPSATLLLTQGPATAADRQAAPVGASAVVEQVRIGDASGEYVKGAYFNYGGDRVANWDPNTGAQSLRWEENGILYTMITNGPVDSQPFQLDKAGLVDLAAALTGQTTTPITQPTAESAKNAAEAGKEAGFEVAEPTWLPEGYGFERATYLPERKTVCLEYRHPADQPVGDPTNPPAPSLSIAESASTPLPELDELIASGLRPDQVLLEKENVQVGGALDEKGIYAYGSLDASKLCGSILEHQVLLVQTEGLHIAIFARESGPFSDGQNWLTRQDMVRVAESITGENTITEGQLDPGFLPSIEDARRMASFPLKVAARLPEGMHFSYAQVIEEGDRQTVVIHYSDGSQEISISQTKGSPDTLETILAKRPESYLQTRVHQQPALISQGFWDQNGWKEIANGGDGEASVTWFEDGIEYTVSGFNAYPSQVWLDIAEGVG